MIYDHAQCHCLFLKLQIESLEAPRVSSRDDRLLISDKLFKNMNFLPH